MINANPTEMVKDLTHKKIFVTRKFDATADLVWRAWTEHELLDEWWAPKPFKAKTKSQDFCSGGHWLYAMIGPDGTEHWAKLNYTSIDPQVSFEGYDMFCDSKGNLNHDFPTIQWKVKFHNRDKETIVKVELSFETLDDLEKIVSMGFEEGFTMALGNLDKYISAGLKLRKEYKTSNKARVTTYLNFPGKTEEAFNFYKEVFRGEFTGNGLRRFGDIEMPKEVKMSEADKKLVIHAELTIMGGHVLMATDSPESMGFKMEYGNNMHINVEPETREETERLFKALSAGGKVEMPLNDMFWGAYFASFRDQYGINWMLHHQTK